MTQRVAVLGTGKIGEALVSGLLRAGQAGRPRCWSPRGARSARRP